MSSRRENQRAWLLILPVVVVVSFSAIVPLMTVVNYSVQDIFPNRRIFVGLEWFRWVVRNPELHAAFVRQLVFSALVLAIEIPLGLSLALAMPKEGRWSTFWLLLIPMPLLIPWNVVGTIWQIFSRSDIGLGGVALGWIGLDYNPTAEASHAWLTVMTMDVWHWTSLVVLLCFAGLKAVPESSYQAAAIDGASRWAVFRHVELPRLRGVLTIAVLLRFMDSFMIYTEPFVLTGGGPGSATTFLSQHLTMMAVGGFDLGKAAAFSLIYFLFILVASYVFYTVMVAQESDS